MSKKLKLISLKDTFKNTDIENSDLQYNIFAININNTEYVNTDFNKSINNLKKIDMDENVNIIIGGVKDE